MNKTSHKYADVIKAWADGEQIQYRFIKSIVSYCTAWKDWTTDADIPNWNSPYIEFRIKPQTKKFTYRVALMKGVGDDSEFIIFCNCPSAITYDRNLDKNPYFMKWISDEITVEI